MIEFTPDENSIYAIVAICTYSYARGWRVEVEYAGRNPDLYLRHSIAVFLFERGADGACAGSGVAEGDAIPNTVVRFVRMHDGPMLLAQTDDRDFYIGISDPQTLPRIVDWVKRYNVEHDDRFFEATALMVHRLINRRAPYDNPAL